MSTDGDRSGRHYSRSVHGGRQDDVVAEREIWQAAVRVGQIGLGPYDLPEAARRAVILLADLLPGTAVLLSQRDPVVGVDNRLATSHPGEFTPHVSYPLLSVDSRLTGHLEIAAAPGHRAPLGLPDAEATDQLLQVLAGFVDWMHGPLWITTGRPADEHAAIVADTGAVIQVPGRDPGQFLVPGSPLVRTLVAERPPLHVVSRLWWIDPSDGWHRVVLQGGQQGTLVTTRQPELPYKLSGREMEIVTLVAAGFTNEQIARRLFITASTVAKHVERSMRKTGSSSRAVLSVRAVFEGLTLRPLPGGANDDSGSDRG